MTQWRIFTKYGVHTGPRLKYEQNCMVLYRIHNWKVSKEVRDWRWLWLKHRTVTQNMPNETYDFIVPIAKVIRVERWDVNEPEVKV